jgi:hypothetical protein
MPDDAHGLNVHVVPDAHMDVMRQFHRNQYLRSNLAENVKAAEMACEGYGIDDIIAIMRIQRSEARKLVLGIE